MKSNVPQLIATLSGRIVVCKFFLMLVCILMLVCLFKSPPCFHCSHLMHIQFHFSNRSLTPQRTGNEFFLSATGLSERDAKRLTIFSIVQSSQLSNLYKMVARALAPNIVAAAAAGGNKAGDDEEWQAITLKCAPFTNIKNTATASAVSAEQRATTGAGSSSENTTTATTTDSQQQLYITVALMEDEKMANRCFHCILTDCPGTNGELGIVTPELFQKLFTPISSGSSNKKRKVAK